MEVNLKDIKKIYSKGEEIKEIIKDNKSLWIQEKERKLN